MTHRPTKPHALEAHMQQVADGRAPANELRLDPTSGELVLVPRSPAASRPTDGIVLDQFAEEGFFAPPRVVVRSSALAGVQAGQSVPRLAVDHDERTVIHVLGPEATREAASSHLDCVLTLVLPEDLSVARAALEATAAERAHEGRCSVAVVVCAETREAAAALVHGGRAYRCDALVVPSPEQLYARARGLLETEALARRHVAIVGVGSGGSAIAVELAKAGVGRFTLVDPDVLEPANVARHVCGVRDLGRHKVHAVRDAVLDKNPYATVLTYALDVNEDPRRTLEVLTDADLLIGATDGNRSRSNVNRAALELAVPAIFGRAITRAAGGDVLRVRPRQGPCLACFLAQGGFGGADEERSTRRQVDRDAPAYVSAEDRESMVHPGLATDIAPISNMMARLALLELSRDTGASIASLERDLEADYYIWANRRERTYAGLQPMGYQCRELSVLRWYPARAPRQANCMVCADAPELPPPAFSSGPPSWD